MCRPPPCKHTHTSENKQKETVTLSITLNLGGLEGSDKQSCHLLGGWRLLGSKAITSLFIQSLEKTATSQQAQTYLLSIQSYIRAGPS